MEMIFLVIVIVSAIIASVANVLYIHDIIKLIQALNERSKVMNDVSKKLK